MQRKMPVQEQCSLQSREARSKQDPSVVRPPATAESTESSDRHVDHGSSPPALNTISARILSSSHSLNQLPQFEERRSVSTPVLLGHPDTQSLLLYPTSSQHQLQVMATSGHDVESAGAENKNLLVGKKLTYYESTRRHVRRPKLRRAVSLSSSLPDARIGRTRKLYCPRQPPTNLQRTLSISRTNLPIFKKATGKGMTTDQKLVLLCISLVSFFSFLSMAIIAPFFPNEAANKNMSGTLSGLVFSCYALVVMLSSPVLGAFLPVIGAKFMLISGIFVAGVANILFGLLKYINSSQQFALFCFLVRTFEALGAAAFSTASYTYIMLIFPDDIGTAFGFTETCVGFGMSLGPALGAGLYTLGGYGLPFYVLGSLILLNIPLCYFLIPAIDTGTGIKKQENGVATEEEDFVKRIEASILKRKQKSSYISLVTIPEVAVVALVVAIVSQSAGFLDPTLEPHFRQYDLGANVVGFIFLAMSLSYAILSPFVGWAASKMDNKSPLMIAGLLLSAVGLVLLGPSWFLPLEPTVWLSSLAVVLMGFAHAIAFIPTFESILDIAIDKGFPDNVRTYSLVSGLWSAMYSLGEVTGPTFGGLFVDLYDFSNGCTLLAGFSLVAAVVTGITYLVTRSISDGDESMSESDESRESSDDDEEKEPHDARAALAEFASKSVSPTSGRSMCGDQMLVSAAIAVPASTTTTADVEREMAGTI